MQQAFSESHEYIAAIDARFMKKSGKKIPSLAWFYNGAQGAAERGLEVFLISAVNLKANTAYAIFVNGVIDGTESFENRRQSA